LGNEELIIAVNVGNESVTASFDCIQLQNQPQKLLYGRGEIKWNAKDAYLKIPARSGCILGFKDVECSKQTTETQRT
jgi:hypothetical protein